MRCLKSTLKIFIGPGRSLGIRRVGSSTVESLDKEWGWVFEKWDDGHLIGLSSRVFNDDDGVRATPYQPTYLPSRQYFRWFFFFRKSNSHFGQNRSIDRSFVERSKFWTAFHYKDSCTILITSPKLRMLMDVKLNKAALFGSRSQKCIRSYWD